MQLYRIAFLQWRMKFPRNSEYYDEYVQGYMITTRLSHLNHGKKKYHRVSQETEVHSQLYAEFLYDYEIVPLKTPVPGAHGKHDKRSTEEKKAAELQHLQSIVYQNFHINSFAQIGVEDPFPEDSMFLQGSVPDEDERIFRPCKSKNELVYHKSRFVRESSPNPLFLPRKELMLKLIRACIEVKRPSELWFNQGDNKIESSCKGSRTICYDDLKTQKFLKKLSSITEN